MPCIPTKRTDNSCSKIWLLRTLPRLVRVVATVCAARPISLPQSAIEQRKLPQLHAAQVILTFRHLHPLSDHLLDPLYSLVHAVQVIASHKGMQRLVLARHWPILAANLSFLDRPFASNYDLSTSVLLHRLESVPTWTNEQTYKVDVRIRLLRDHHFV